MLTSSSLRTGVKEKRREVMELENDKVMVVFEWASSDLFLVKKYK